MDAAGWTAAGKDSADVWRMEGFEQREEDGDSSSKSFGWTPFLLSVLAAVV